MLFNSLNFLLFFSIVFTAYWLIPLRFRWIILLISSYFFYAFWNPIYILLLFFSTITDYLLSRYLTSSSNHKRSRLGLITTILLNFGLLFSFKYYDFVVTTISELLVFLNLPLPIQPPTLSLILPVGISFYTFQSISYAVDVYRKTIPIERHFGRFALYISFFPQLVAGPIERAGDLLPQLRNFKLKLELAELKQGMHLILWGLFMKVVIADNLAYFVNLKYGSVTTTSGGEMLFATIIFSFQVYADFNGYSTIARGTAKLLGFDLMKNFNFPFFSRSWKELWTKWHISLSQWMRDYLFIPLGGSRKSKLITYRNVLIVFTLSGLWHGSSTTFVFWGFLCGLIWVIEDVTFRLFAFNYPFKNYFSKWIKPIIIYSIFVLCLIPFRSSSINEAVVIYSKIAHLEIKDVYFWFADNRYSPGMLGLYVLFLSEATIYIYPKLKEIDTSNSFYLLWNIALLFAILLLGHDAGNQFIYFQF